MSEIIVLIISILAFIGGIIAVWVNLNVKIKELDVKILNIEGKINDDKIEHNKIATDLYREKNEILILVEKQNDKIWDKLEKIDLKLEIIADLRAELKKTK